MKENKKHKNDPHRKDPEEQVEQQETTPTDDETPAQEPKGEEESQVDDLLDKYAELQDSYLRLRAEFDNYKKRTLREKSDLMKYGAERTVVTMLGVLEGREMPEKTVFTAEIIQRGSTRAAQDK